MKRSPKATRRSSSTPTSRPSVSATATDSAGWHLASQFQVEIEYGITDRLELGLYLTLQPVDLDFPTAPDLGEGNGVKQRLRYRFADSGVWPVDVAVYGELTENQREIELEGKIILQRRVGRSESPPTCGPNASTRTAAKPPGC